MELFERLQVVNDHIESGNSATARNELIRTLDYIQKNEIAYSEIINHLIRRVGLFPYMQPDSASWEDRFVYESFKVNIGKDEPVTLHREQSRILKGLLEGRSLAISAPTSFGKSFIVDSFIALKMPKNVVIIVPTIALTDETRRRLQQKFSDRYKIITTTDVEMSERNIFVFPQERAINYAERIESIDILIIDEFYKASVSFDKERAPALVRAILKLEKKASQKYFLAPNISTLNDNPFTENMEFVKLDYNTVFLKVQNFYERLEKDEEKKGRLLLEILNRYKGKTLIYAGNYPNIDKVSTLVIANTEKRENQLLSDFVVWLRHNYDANWRLVDLISRGTGVHNGQMHRSLSQIQIRLFEELNGIDRIISTSSIIEGVNTSAENIVIWRNKNGQTNLNDFTYKNIIGRGGRMFRHFIGNIFVLERPPNEEQTQLDLFIPDQVIDEIGEEDQARVLTREQIIKIIAYKEEMTALIGASSFKKLTSENTFQVSDFNLTLNIARAIKSDLDGWSGLGALNSENVAHWDSMLYKVINLQPGNWGVEYSKFVAFIKIISKNWAMTIPELLRELDIYDLGIDDLFKLERNVSYLFSSLLQDVNSLQKSILKSASVDIAPFIFRVTHAFLPKVVYQLEEYGLPRMIAKKIQTSGVIDLENEELTLHGALEEFREVGIRKIQSILSLDSFDKYILEYFYEGILLKKS